MSDEQRLTVKEAGGAFADSLTLIRILVTPVIMALIVYGWPDTSFALLASALFIIGALTDIFDDYFGGAAKSELRKYGWMDDIADTILILGTLLALSFVLYREGILEWPFLVPFAILVLREIGVGIIKGFDLARYGLPARKLTNAKIGLSILAVCVFVASPWLTQFVDLLRVNYQDPMEVYNSASPWVWIFGQVVLWIAALFSIISAVPIFKTKHLANDA